MRRKSAPGGERSGGTARVASEQVLTLRDLDQIRVLADPLRIRLLEAFCEEATTMQVAERLGEKPTRLYHHVEALEKVGLIKLSRTRKKRGTLERYYLAVARTFRADSRAFEAASADPAGVEAQSFQAMLSMIFDTTRDELQRAVAQGASQSSLEEEGVVSYCEVRANPRALRELRERLHGMLETLADLEDDDASRQRRYRLTLAYFPLPD